MPARFNAYPPDRAALVRLLDDGAHCRIGRDAGCELRVDHTSVSRFHATLDHDGGAWSLRDSGSKNGVRVDGRRVDAAVLGAATWFAIGDVYCSLELLDPDAAHHLREQRESQGARFHHLSARLSQSAGIDRLIEGTLDVVLGLAGLDRGFVLYAPSGEPLRMRAQRGLTTAEIPRREFAGSIAAVERALATRRTVVCCDTHESPWLGARPSVRLGGLRAVLCVPLGLADQPFGALYADSRQPGPALTELDLELIESVAGHAATMLSVRELRGAVASLLDDAARAGFHAPRWDELLGKTRA